MNEAKILFSYKNPNIEEGYILMKNFFNNFKVEWKDYEIEKVDTEYDIKKLNEEFKSFHTDILNIVRNDIIQENEKRNKYKNNQYKNKHSRQFNKISFDNISLVTNDKTRPRPVSTSKLILDGDNKLLSQMPILYPKNTNAKPKYNSKKYLLENLKKQKEEDLNIRQNFDKRQKEFIKDCIKKITEANKICYEMNIKKSYSTITDNVSD